MSLEVAVSASSTETGWDVSISYGAVTHPTRKLASGKAGNKSLPLLPESELATRLAHDRLRELAQGGAEFVHSLLGRIRVQPDAGDVELCGRYLFGCLFGTEAWDAVTAGAAGSIEILLNWPVEEHALSALPWEMMRGPDGFLGADTTRSVAIVRVVPGAPNKPTVPLVAPLRVLFVVGTSLNASEIRAGAEYMNAL
jgi:hypothetical protein